MSSLQEMNRRALSFSEQMKRRSAKSHQWARGLKLRAAAGNLLILVISAVPWLIGRFYYWVKWLFGVLIFAFKSGAKSEG